MKGLKVIFLIVFLYLVGFGVIIPLLPILGKHMGATPIQIGLLMSAYSFMQFLFAPFWGRISDQRGRRPVLLICLLGESLSYLIFAFSRSFEMLLLARALAGFFGGSISTASAAISDCTPKHERSKGMALIGMAFGLGFIVGPALGGGLASLSEVISTEPFFASTFTMSAVAVICFLTFLLALKILPETRPSEPNTAHHVNSRRLVLLYQDLLRPTVGGLIGVFFLTTTAMACMEATLSLFVFERFGWGIKEASYGFAYIGVLATFNQGFLVRRLLPKWGERRLLIIGVLLMALSFALIGLSDDLFKLWIAMTILPFGTAMTNPSILGSVSLLSGNEEQGRVLGSAQGASALGRIVGPMLGALVYQKIGITSPFILASFVALAGFVMILMLWARLPQAAKLEGQGATA